MNHEPVPLSESLDRVLKGLRSPDRHQVGGLFGRWGEIVGDLVARHVRPVRLESRVLVVEVDEPAWATQFEFLSGQVVDRLRAEVGVEVDRVETRVARQRWRFPTVDETLRSDPSAEDPDAP